MAQHGARAMKRSKSYTWLSGLLRARAAADDDEWGAGPWVRPDLMHNDRYSPAREAHSPELFVTRLSRKAGKAHILPSISGTRHTIESDEASMIDHRALCT